MSRLPPASGSAQRLSVAAGLASHGAAMFHSGTRPRSRQMTGWILKQSTFRDRRAPPAATGLALLVRRLVMRFAGWWAAWWL
jgi:hypothetical protein